MKHLEATQENIRLASRILTSGGLVAFPTETVYGLGADGLNEIAVSKIFEAKKRPSFNPLILHISSIDMLERIAECSSEQVKSLTKNFWPGPLTLVLQKKEIVPYIVTSGLETVAVRMPDNQIALELIDKLGSPIAAPSANEFSRLSPTRAEHVVEQLGDKVDIILDGGKCDVGVESTIIRIAENVQYLLRPGGTPREDVEKIIGELSIPQIESAVPDSPGQLKVHYAPDTPIKFLREEEIFSGSDLKMGGIFFSKVRFQKHFTVTKILSEKKDLHEAASNLFSYLHDMDSMNLDLILVEPVEEQGLGIAIMDRLNKAVNKFMH